MKKIPIEVSARHVHLSLSDLEALFGKGYELKKLKRLTQASDFAAKETVDIKNGLKTIKNVRVVGPVRKKSQVEISRTDAFNLGVKIPLRLSGNLEGTPGIILIGPKGKVCLKEGTIDDQRHIHCNLKEAKVMGFNKNSVVSVKVEGRKSLTFHNIKVRIGKDYKLSMHIDTDEGNAAGINKKGEGILIWF